MREGERFYIISAPKSAQGSAERNLAGVLLPAPCGVVGDYSEVFLLEVESEPQILEEPTRLPSLYRRTDYVSYGANANVFKRRFKIAENGQTIMFAVKQYEYGISDRELKKMLEINSRLIARKVHALRLYTDGKNLFSRFLCDKSAVAVSSNNAFPKNCYAFYKKAFNATDDGKIAIDNIDELICQAKQIARLSASAKVFLADDCLLFRLSKENRLCKAEATVGDYDLLKNATDDTEATEHYNKNMLKICLERFFKKYIRDDLLPLYNQKLADIFYKKA